MTSTEQRRWNIKQAIASARIEGFEPSPDFLADVDLVIRGELTFDQVRERSLARALAREAPSQHLRTNNRNATTGIPSQKQPRLRELIDGITPENLHGEH